MFALISSAWSALSDAFDLAQQWIFETCLQPLAFAVGLGNRLEEGYLGTGWLLVGLLELAVLVVVIRGLERWRPVEPVTDRATVRVDVIYTLIHRLGLFRLVMFFTLTPVMDDLIGHLRVWGLPTFNLDDLWPGVTDRAWVSLIVYLLVMDFVDYWVHRAQHQFEWWWRLHALHHAQRQMTMWSDNRNHLLDDMLRELIVVVVVQLIGVPPEQFVALVAITQLSESLQHANARIWFGRVGERLWVSPRFHRRHHGIGVGHETGKPDGRTVLGGCNFGVLLPWWDMMFGTADFTLRFDPTGVRDQVEQGRDYGGGFWAQQWRGVLRLFGRA